MRATLHPVRSLNRKVSAIVGISFLIVSVVNRLGFQEVNYVQAFQEFELRLDLDERSADIDGYCNDGCIASFDGDDE